MRFLVKALGGRKEQDEKNILLLRNFSGTTKGLESIKYKKRKQNAYSLHGFFFYIQRKDCSKTF